MTHKTKSKGGHSKIKTKFSVQGAPEQPTVPEAATPERRFPRVPAQTSVLVRKLGGNIKGELSTTMVVGKGGCSFIHPQPQGTGSELYLSILVGLDVVEARVKVVYNRPQEDGAFEIGVEFLEVAKRDEPILNTIFQ
jgi:hypothetical protein